MRVDGGPLNLRALKRQRVDFIDDDEIGSPAAEVAEKRIVNQMLIEAERKAQLGAAHNQRGWLHVAFQKADGWRVGRPVFVGAHALYDATGLQKEQCADSRRYHPARQHSVLPAVGQPRRQQRRVQRNDVNQIPGELLPIKHRHDDKVDRRQQQ